MEKTKISKIRPLMDALPTVLKTQTKLNEYSLLIKKMNNKEDTSLGLDRCDHRLNMELNLQSLFGLLCTAVLIS